MAFMQKLKVIPSQTSQDFSKPVKAYIKAIIEMVTEYNLFCQVQCVMEYSVDGNTSLTGNRRAC